MVRPIPSSASERRARPSVRGLLLGGAIVLLTLSERSVVRAYHGPDAPAGTSDALAQLAGAAVLLIAVTTFARLARAAETAPSAVAAGLALLALVSFEADWQVANILTLAALLVALVAMCACGVDRDTIPSVHVVRAGVVLGLVSAGGALIAASSFDVSSVDVGRWSAYGDGTWTVIAALSLMAAAMLVRSRPRWWPALAPALVAAAYVLHDLWIAYPFDAIDLTIFLRAPVLILAWLLAATVLWHGASSRPPASIGVSGGSPTE